MPRRPRSTKPWVTVPPGSVDCIHNGTLHVTGGTCFITHDDRAHVECAALARPDRSDITMTVITKPAAKTHHRHCQLIAALRIETRTGMSHSRGSVMNMARKEFDITQRTKAGVLAELEKKYKATYGRAYGSKEPFQ